MYSEFLGDWLRVFPRSQLLILRNEDYKVSQREHMDAVFKFLGAPRPAFAPALSGLRALRAVRPAATNAGA